MILTLADYQRHAMACQKKANSAHAETRPFWLEITNSWLFLAKALGSFSLKQKEGTNGLSRKRLPLRRREEVETTDDATPVEMERPEAKTRRGTVLTMPAPPLTLSAF